MAHVSIFPGQKAGKVTWLAFVLVAMVAALTGSLANYKLMRLVEDHMLQHGMEHNQDVATKTIAALRELQRQGMAEAEMLARLRQAMRVAAAFGYEVFLIDAPSARVIVHSRPAIAEGRPHLTHLFHAPVRLRADDGATGSWLGQFRANDATGHPLLLFLDPVDARWTLGVTSGVHYLEELRVMLTQRLRLLVLATAAVVALLGFLIVRGMGRHYERALEREVRVRTGELERVHGEMLHKARLAAIGQTAVTLTHEMRNPLASIRLGVSELAALPALDARQRRRADIALEQVERLDALLSEALGYARPVKRSPYPVSLDGMLDYVLEMLEPLLVGKAIRIRRETCPTCAGVRLDRDLMIQALLNLLKNALEASPDGGTIAIAVRPRARDLLLEIRNDGDPIAVGDLKRVFEPFVSTKSFGTGLGLPLVKRVIEEHGGSIGVLSDVRQGTRFSVTLPAAETVSAPESASPRFAPLPASVAGGGGVARMQAHGLMAMLLAAMALAGGDVALANPSDGAAAWDRHVVKVEVSRADGRLEVGSAVPLAGGLFVTNCHVLRDARDIRLSSPAGKWTAKISAGDAYRDLCFIEVANYPGAPVPMAEVDAARVGMPVYAVGYTGGRFSVSQGQVRALHICPCDGGRVIQTTATFDRGSSGGGLFDSHGRLLGILTFKSQAGGDFHFAVPAGWLRRLAALDQLASAGGKPFWEQGGKDSGYFLAACALGAKQDWRPLAKLAGEWTHKEPYNPEAWMALGRARLGLGKLDQAGEAFRRALLLDSTHAEAVWELEKLEFLQ